MIRIVLFQPEKPANTGNIIRTAMALNAKLSIIKPITFSLDEKALKRAGMDYAVGFDIELLDDVDAFFKKYENYETYFVTRYATQVYSNMDYTDTTKNYCFMFGRESSGIPKEILKNHLDTTIRIPMMANARSLNLSDSVSIVLSEVRRQQKFQSLSIYETIKGKDFLLH